MCDILLYCSSRLLQYTILDSQVLKQFKHLKRYMEDMIKIDYVQQFYGWNRFIDKQLKPVAIEKHNAFIEMFTKQLMDKAN